MKTRIIILSLLVCCGGTTPGNSDLLQLLDASADVFIDQKETTDVGNVSEDLTNELETGEEAIDTADETSADITGEQIADIGYFDVSSDEMPNADSLGIVDCSAIANHPNWELCASGPYFCHAVFYDSAGCQAVCAAAGLLCHAVFENIDGQCAADKSRPPLSCSPESGHKSDYCVCLLPGACTPSCDGKSCGDDGCGGSCGFCPGGAPCENGQCVCKPLTCLSASLQCGSGHPDGCGGTFSCPGTCPPGLACKDGFCGGPPPPCKGDVCPAFPGAEGEGMYARGGRGGDVCRVTTTADSGPGSLRACAETQKGPRTVVFQVGGLITLKSPLTFNHDGLTLAGQTAPGDGIQIRGYQVNINANDVIIQHLRFRAGDIYKKQCPDGGSGFTEDSLTISGSRIIVDHVSASWGIDENLSGGSRLQEATVQYSIISEGLYQTGLYHGDCNSDYNPGGSKGHSMGSLFKPSEGNGSISVHHNIYAHNGNRNPAVGTYATSQTFRADIRNNLIYNCPSMGYVSGESKEVKVNYVGNYGVFGPSSSSDDLFKGNANANVKLYQSDNRLDKNKNKVFDGIDLGWTMFSEDFEKMSSPFTFNPVTTHPSSQVPSLLISWAGARPWTRDEVDKRIVKDIQNNTGGLINTQSSVGGWGTLDPGTPVVDTDEDGMPDSWEIEYGTNPAIADNNGDLDGDGWTNLEEYLHWAARPTQ